MFLTHRRAGVIHRGDWGNLTEPGKRKNRVALIVVIFNKLDSFFQFQEFLVALLLCSFNIWHFSYNRALKGVFGILGSWWKKLGSWDLTPFEIGILETRSEIGILENVQPQVWTLDLKNDSSLIPGTWDLTLSRDLMLFEIGISGSQDPPFRALIMLVRIFTLPKIAGNKHFKRSLSP